jgi:Predicted Zn peptidase
MKVTNINPGILKELLSKTPEARQAVKSKYPKFERWLKGDDYPTHKQLVGLSKIFHVPFGYFFLEKLPERKYPVPHYRTVQDKEFQPSNELLETILFAQKVQEWAKDILLEWGKEKLSFCGKYRDNYDINEVVKELKEIFEVQEGWANQKTTWTEAFGYLTSKAEEKGIIVLRNGVVGNNTHRKLDVNEFRGFVLYDEIAPVIFINNNDAISAKVFTFIHEVAHILIGESASFDLRNLQSANNKIEKFCDKCTAEFLVPTEEIYDIYEQKRKLEDLAKYFKVSQIVILRRLLDTNLIGPQKFYEQLKKIYEVEIRKRHSEGGDFYRTVPNRLSKRFVQLLIGAVQNNTILFRDALRIANLKPNTFDVLVKRAI